MLCRTAGSGKSGDAICADALYPRWADFLRPNDIVTETGTSSMGLAFAPMPQGASFDSSKKRVYGSWSLATGATQVIAKNAARGPGRPPGLIRERLE